MENLLQSDFYRLFKSKSFYICSLVSMFFLTINIFILDWSVSNMPFKDGISYGLTALSNSNVRMIIAIFTSIFITSEFAHGTMKNVVSKGFARLKIYLSKVITMTVAAFIIIMLTFLIGTISATIVTGTLGDFTGGFVGYMLKNMGIELLLHAALTSVFVMVAMVIRNIGGVIAINIIGIMTVDTFIFVLLEYLFHNTIKFTKYSLMNNIGFYFMNQTATGSDYIRSILVGLAFLAVSTAFGIFMFKKTDVN